MNKALHILLQSYEILYDKNLKGCVYKRLQISDLSGLKKDYFLTAFMQYFNCNSPFDYT